MRQTTVAFTLGLLSPTEKTIKVPIPGMMQNVIGK
jgi:hypothetical protein